MECREFRELLLYLNPELTDEDIPHGDKFKDIIMALYWEEYEKVVTELRVSLNRKFSRCSFDTHICCSRIRRAGSH